MNQSLIRKRFRKEIRNRPDINPSSTLILCDDPLRAANTSVAVFLLNELFGDRISISYASDGLICGSREEAAVYRLMEFTQDTSKNVDVLLCELPYAWIQRVSDERNFGEVYVPDSAEFRFVESLSADFSDIRFGL